MNAKTFKLTSISTALLISCGSGGGGTGGNSGNGGIDLWSSAKVESISGGNWGLGRSLLVPRYCVSAEYNAHPNIFAS